MSEPRETRDEFGRVLCWHGRPMECLQCGEEYAAELNGPAGGARDEADARERDAGSSQSTGAPDPSVPLSAIRALVQQWRERVAVCRRISAESAARGELVLGRAWAEEADHKQESITELTALCPAPPEDQK